MGAFVGRSEQLKGTRLGAYEIVRLLGHGATASVFEGVHVALGKPVAIKLLHEHLAHDRPVRARFLREGRVAARLRHPNIVDALDVGLDGDVPYLVMELLTGSDLRALLADQTPLPVERALAIVLPIAAGLAHAHEAGVIHRDLKPGNIFLARSRRGDVIPKLVDFGLSKATLGDMTSSLTQSEVAGTALYMAPEQTLGVKNASPASDQYSLAAVLYEAIAGQPPFAPDAMHVLLDRIRTGTIPPPSHLRPALPAALDAAVLCALSRDPKERFPGVRAFGAALLPFAGKAAAALERDFTERAGKGARASARPAAKKARPVEPRASGDSRVKSEARTETEPRVGSEPRLAGKRFAVAPVDLDAPLPCAPGASPFHIKGMPYRGFLLLVDKVVPGGLERFCEALPDPRLAAFLHQPFLATGRYDVFPFVPLFATLARVLGTPFDELVRMASTSQCRYDSRTVFKVMFSSRGQEAVAERFTRLNAQYYDFGKFGATLLGPNHIVLDVSEVPAYFLPWFGPMHVTYAEEATRIVGGKNVRTVSMAVEALGKTGGYPLVRSRSELTWET